MSWGWGFSGGRGWTYHDCGRWRDLARKGCTGEEVNEGGTKDVGEVGRLLMFKGKVF